MRALLAVSILVAASVISAPTYAASQPILIFGGADHNEFLGCLNCGDADPASVWNDGSKYGWGNDYGVWNEYGQYGGEYGSYSACNEYTSNPPVLVDRQGNSYGYLSVNEYKSGSVCGVTGDEQICQALKVMCAHPG